MAHLVCADFIFQQSFLLGCDKLTNAGMAVKNFLEINVGSIDQFLELGNLANLLEGNNFIFLVSIDAKTCRVVTTVL